LAFHASGFAPKSQHLGAKVGAAGPADRIVFDFELAKQIRIGQGTKHGTPKLWAQIDPTDISVAELQLDPIIVKPSSRNDAVEFRAIWHRSYSSGSIFSSGS
jgi:hypothetical protein